MDLKDKLKKSFVNPKIHKNHSKKLAISELENDIDAHDDIESNNDELAHISGLMIILNYQNSNNVATTRLVTCIQTKQLNDKMYLLAFCHSRKSIRTFRIDRIDDIFDNLSGECLNPVNEFFESFEITNFEKSKYNLGLTMNDHIDFMALLNCVVFLARCDQEYHPLEKNVIDSLIMKFWLRLEIMSNPDEGVITELADRMAPDGSTFWKSLKLIIKKPLLIKIMRELANEVIAADGIINDDEFLWGNEIDKFFRENA